MARREWAIVGCLCTLGVGLLVYMVIFSLGPNNPISAICDVGILAIESDAYQRVFEVL